MTKKMDVLRRSASIRRKRADVLAALLAELMRREALGGASAAATAPRAAPGTSPTRAGCATGRPARGRAPSKICSRLRAELRAAPLRGEAVAQLEVAVGRVEDPPDDELRRDRAVPGVLLEAEGDVVVPDAAAAVELRRRGRRRSRSRRVRGGRATRKRRCLPSPTVVRSLSSQPADEQVTPGLPSPNGASRRSSAQRPSVSAAPGTIASTDGDRPQIVVGEVRVGVRGEGVARASSTFSGRIERPAAARWPPKRSRCSEQAARPACRSKAGIERPVPFQSPSVPAIRTTGRW